MPKHSRISGQSKYKALCSNLFCLLVWRDDVTDDELSRSSLNVIIEPGDKPHRRFVSILRGVFDIDGSGTVLPDADPAVRHIADMYFKDYSVFSFEGPYTFLDPLNGIGVTVVLKIWAELHTEYFALSGHIDQCGVTDDPGDQAIEALAQLASIINQKLRPGASAAAQDLAPLQTLLLDQVWHSLIETLDADEQLGDCFADFRSLLVSADLTPPTEVEGSTQGVLRKPKWRQRKLPIHELDAMRAEFTRNTTMPLVDAIWDFLGQGRDERMHSKEAAVSWFHNMQVIYVSTLGAPPADFSDLPSHRLNFVIATTSPNRWQTGRLVNRMHTLGVLRLAALFDLEKLVKASSQLQNSDFLVEKAFREDRQTVGQDESSLKLQQWSKLIAEIDEPFPFGLSWRIERSRYYAEQFRSAVKQLHDDRIEGFQRYTDFVARRIGVRFDFIDRLGKRYERLTQRIQRLTSQDVAAKSATLAANLFEVQNKAEDFLLLGILPYYAGHILFYIAVSPFYLAAQFIAPKWLKVEIPTHEEAETLS